IDELEAKIHIWVDLYEEYYYQYREDRLSVCTTVVHGLLHIPENIRYCAPSWATWTFHIERMCGDFQGHLGSKSAPASNINKHVLHGAYLDQLGNRFDMSNELSEVGKKPKGALSQNETIKGSYEDYILRTPHKKKYRPDDNMRRMITDYFREITQANRNTIKARLPDNMPLWGKFHIAHSGDSVRCTMATSRKRSERNMSFVRFELIVFDEPKMIPFLTDGKDATQELTFYRTETAPIITDLATIRAVIGRVQTTGGPSTQQHWGIIDRSSALTRTTFEERDSLSDEDDDDSD
ncbi:hypothetical protein PILCRDRAFT_2726, partial [Piloderma croceum F 1598]